MKYEMSEQEYCRQANAISVNMAKFVWTDRIHHSEESIDYGKEKTFIRWQQSKFGLPINHPRLLNWSMRLLQDMITMDDILLRESLRLAGVDADTIC